MCRSPDSQLEARGSLCWLSLLHLITNWSGLQTLSGVPRAPSAGCGFPYHISSLTHLISNSDFLSWPSYIIVHAHLLVGVTIALIQPIYGQGYNFDIPRPDAPVIYIGVFPILTAWTGRRSIYNSLWYFLFSNLMLDYNIHLVYKLSLRWYEVFLSNINNFRAIIWCQIFLFNINNFHSVI